MHGVRVAGAHRPVPGAFQCRTRRRHASWRRTASRCSRLRCRCRRRWPTPASYCAGLLPDPEHRDEVAAAARRLPQRRVLAARAPRPGPARRRRRREGRPGEAPRDGGAVRRRLDGGRRRRVRHAPRSASARTPRTRCPAAATSAAGRAARRALGPAGRRPREHAPAEVRGPAVPRSRRPPRRPASGSPASSTSLARRELVTVGDRPGLFMPRFDRTPGEAGAGRLHARTSARRSARTRRPAAARAVRGIRRARRCAPSRPCSPRTPRTPSASSRLVIADDVRRRHRQHRGARPQPRACSTRGRACSRSRRSTHVPDDVLVHRRDGRRDERSTGRSRLRRSRSTTSRPRARPGASAAARCAARRGGRGTACATSRARPSPLGGWCRPARCSPPCPNARREAPPRSITARAGPARKSAGISCNCPTCPDPSAKR
jgi:hypothetical protein